MTASRASARVEGTVQGVGFRPYVYRRALDHGLAGWVLNDERGVVLEVEGPPERVEAFFDGFEAGAPPLAVVERVTRTPVSPTGETGFRIAASERRTEPSAPVTPDTATCDDCLAELFDPADRRHRYPFVNCTNCGPRFTIVRGVPYDRLLTTMAGFTMCPACQAEYDDPADRRFHAQPNACPECGPRAVLLGAEDATDPLEVAARALLDGAVLAVKGVGGYHLACRADDEAAVAALRARKHREDKPFALMAPALEHARALVDLGPEDEALLTSPRRPIVIAPRARGAGVAACVAPRAADLGVMLPYSPLHHLLAADCGVTLVLTSGNVSDEPIAFEDDDALRRLAPIADRFLVHDRPIETRTDDSVVRSVPGGSPLLFRRSRGYVPGAVGLPVEAGRPVLACGAELKSAFCLAKGSRAWVSHHIGDLKNYETLRSFEQGVDHFAELFAVEPEVVAHDLHPDYLSTSYALTRPAAAHVGVQHHHAHLAACLAEHGATGPAVGLMFDGTGYGTDGTVWGGELLVGGLEHFERAGSLWPVRMPGGEQAVREPWRMARSWLVQAGADAPPRALAEKVDLRTWESVGGLSRGGPAAPLTTSAGRLFDAVAAICGIRARVNYEGQAAVELEATADVSVTDGYEVPLMESEGLLRLDARPLVAAATADSDAGAGAAIVAARFHNGLAAATAEAAARVAEAASLATVVLSGGVFQNRLLLMRTRERLEQRGLRVLVPRLLPPNDGGVAYGQAAVAAARGVEQDAAIHG